MPVWTSPWRSGLTDDGVLKVSTCPVLALTPEVESSVNWFYATHEFTNADGRFWWRRTALPHAGGVGDQDCRLMAEIEYLASVMNGVLAAQQQPKKKPTEEKSSEEQT